MHITLQNISKSFGSNSILTDFSLEIHSGMRLCLCGPNGCGKSTVLKLIAGVDAPDAGRVLLQQNCRLGYVEQELDAERLQIDLLSFVLDVLPDWKAFWTEWNAAAEQKDETTLQSLAVRQTELEMLYGYNPEHKAKTVLSGLGFDQSKWDKPLQELSGGWRERAKLARILTAGADVLLLDEPTNHLDVEAVEWLENFLLEYKGVLLFVAHDLFFMDKVGTHVLYLGGGKPVFRRGNFTQFVAVQEEIEEQKGRESVRLQNEIHRKMAFVRRFKAKASKARQASSQQKMAKRLEKELDTLQPELKQRELSFKWPQPPQSDRTVLSVSGLEFSFPDGKRLWDTLDFTLYRGQKIALVGPNGCGKSTLLKVLTGERERNAGTSSMGQLVRLGYFHQHQLEMLNALGSVLGEIRRLSDPKLTEEELMSVLGLFMLGQSYFERLVSSLSGGEKSRLILATLFLRRCNFLILDEPTNHLDLESREALIEALENFSGTILMVAHDRHLLSAVAEEVWALSPQGFTHYDSWDAYNEARKDSLASQSSEAKKEQGSSNLSREELRIQKREQAELRNRLYKEVQPVQKQYTSLEKKLETLLARQATVEAQLADPEVYAKKEQASQLLQEFASLQAEAEKIFEHMAALEIKLAEYEVQRAQIGAE